MIEPRFSLSSSCSPRCTARFEWRCAGAVVFVAQTKRWFITMGHASFNSRANNASGYRSEGAARKAIMLPKRAPARVTVRECELCSSPATTSCSSCGRPLCSSEECASFEAEAHS